MSGLFVRLRGWRPEDRWACLLAYALLLVWCLPLLLKPNHFGVPDWDWFQSYFYAIRVSLLEHGQFPGYNPWMYMGSPLWANPQIGPISYLTPWVLLCGPVIGLKLGLVTCYWLSFEAGRSLGRHLFQHPLAAVIAGLLYALNTALASHWVMGHFCFAAYPLLPWLVLWCLRLDSHYWSGLWAGVLAGLMVQIGVHYLVVYGFLACAILTLVHGVQRRAWRSMVRFGSLGSLAFLVVALSKLMPMLLLLRDFPRQMKIPFSIPWSSVWPMFGMPVLGPVERWMTMPHGSITMSLTGNEFFSYAGFALLAFALLSVRRGIRFFHVGAILGFWLLLGNDRPWHLSYWLGMLPPFDSMWVFVRWRVFVLACLAFAAAQSVDHLLINTPTAASVWRRRWPRWVVWLLPLELIVLLLPTWWAGVTVKTYPTLSRKALKLPKTRHIIAMQELRPDPKGDPLFYPLFVNNIGVTKGYEPLFGYRIVTGAHVYVGHPGYLGEYLLTGGKSATPTLWSPNRIVFQGLPPGEMLWLNITPGRGWTMNGQALFREDIMFALQKYFLVKVPPSGKVDLRYTVLGLEDSLWISLMCMLVLLLWWNRSRKTKPLLDAGG